MNKTHKKTSLSDYKMILYKVKIPCDRYFSCSKVYYSNYSKL